MALGEAARYARAGDIAQSYATIDRVLSANPDDSAALLLKAQINLREGRPLDALELGEVLCLRVPSDFRGYLMVGFALSALGRQREALNALNTAISVSRSPPRSSPSAPRSTSGWASASWPPTIAPTPHTCAPKRQPMLA